jgi:hypothetical protein
MCSTNRNQTIVASFLAAMLWLFSPSAIAGPTDTMEVALPRMIVMPIETEAQVNLAVRRDEGMTPTMVCVAPDHSLDSQDFIDLCGRLAAEFASIQFRVLDALAYPNLAAELLREDPASLSNQPVVYLNVPPSSQIGRLGGEFGFSEQTTHTKMTVSRAEQFIYGHTGIKSQLLVPRELDLAHWERAKPGDQLVLVLYPDLNLGGKEAADSYSMFALWGIEARKYAQHAGDDPQVYRLSYTSPLYGGVIGGGAKLSEPTLAVVHVKDDGHGGRIGTLSFYNPVTCNGVKAPDLDEAEAQLWMKSEGFVLPPSVVAWVDPPRLAHTAERTAQPPAD